MPHIWVKVVGFSDAERHSLNTLFRLAERQVPEYVLWTAESPSPPQVALLDLESYESELEMASPYFNTRMKLICVGPQPLTQAWCTLPRPVDWVALVKVLDTLFVPQAEIDLDLESGGSGEKLTPPGVKVPLLVGFTRDQRLYLRSRLSIAGITDVDEATTAAQASEKLMQRHYALMMVGLDVNDADPWSLVRVVRAGDALAKPVGSVIVATTSPSLEIMERAENLDCLGVLEIPFDPKQVQNLLHQV